jgi:hypothetical protein
MMQCVSQFLADFVVKVGGEIGSRNMRCDQGLRARR